MQLATLAEHNPDVLHELIGPPLPPHTEDAWRAFLALSAERPTAGGVGRITSQAILAYCEVDGVHLTPLDLACIRAADAAVMRLIVDRMRDPSSTNAPPAPGAPIEEMGATAP